MTRNHPFVFQYHLERERDECCIEKNAAGNAGRARNNDEKRAGVDDEDWLQNRITVLKINMEAWV